MDRRVKIFIDDLRVKCKENNVKLVLSKGETVRDDNLEYLGYFGEEEEGSYVLACALGDKTSTHISALVHESCHMDQWLEGSELWDNSHSWEVFEHWLAGERVSNIKKHLQNIRDLELDCEKRTVKKILSYDLPIDAETYTRKANAYIQFLNFLEHTRKSPNGATLSLQKKEVWKVFPKRFREKRYYDNLTKPAQKIFEKYKLCIE